MLQSGSHLKADDEEENAAGDVNAEAEEDHSDASELAEKVGDDEEGGQVVTAAPGDVHVLALLCPLDPHSNPVLEEGRDEAEPR